MVAVFLGDLQPSPSPPDFAAGSSGSMRSSGDIRLPHYVPACFRVPPGGRRRGSRFYFDSLTGCPKSATYSPGCVGRDRSCRGRFSIAAKSVLRPRILTTTRYGQRCSDRTSTPSTRGTNDFAKGLATSPFQHYWSLAVEVHPYLVWPAVFLLATKRHGLSVFGSAVRWDRRVAIVIGLIRVTSLALSIYETSTSPAAV